MQTLSGKVEVPGFAARSRVCAGLIVLLCCGCFAARRESTATADPERVMTMERNILTPRMPDGDLSVTVAAFQNALTTRYELVIHWRGRQPLYLEGGRTIDFWLDGKSLPFLVPDTAIRFSARCDDGCTFDERVVVAIASRELQKIARAHNVTVRIAGRGTLVRREFNRRNLERFRQFVDRYVQ